MSLFEEIDDYDEQIKELINKIQSALENDLPNLKGNERNEKIKYLKGRIDRLRQVFHSFKVELRELPKIESRRYDDRAREYEKQIADLQADLDRAKEFAQQIHELAGAKTVDQLSAKEAIELSKRIQEQSKQSTERSKAIVEETIDIGAATGQMLKAQTEQIQRIDKQVDEVESNIVLAEKQLRAFMRRMATDKMIMFMVCLVVLGIIAAIIVAAVNGNKIVPTAAPTVIPINSTGNAAPAS